MMKMILYAALYLCGAGEAIACTSEIRVYHWIVCEISSTTKFYSVTQDDSYYLLDGSASGENCEVVEGMKLEVRCEETDHVLHKNGSPLGQRSVEWNFAVAEEVEGNYECRWLNDSLFGSRPVTVEGGVYIVPDADRDSLAGQKCTQVTPDVKCSRSGRSYEFDISGDQSIEYADHYEQFHVLGSRPISLSVDVLWVNHYPVDLQPQWRAMADSNTSLHVIEFTSRDVVFVAGTPLIQFYIAITANSSEGLATTCTLTKLHGAVNNTPISTVDNTLIHILGNAAIPTVTSTAIPTVDSFSLPQAPTSSGAFASIAVLPLAILVLSSSILAICIKQRRHQHNNRQPMRMKLLELEGGELEETRTEDHVDGSGRKDSCHKILGKKVIPRDSIRLLNIIGEGEFGLVYKAHLVKVNSKNSPHATVLTQNVAVKMLKGFHGLNRADALLDEALCMMNLDHPNVLSLIGVCIDECSALCIVMPYMVSGSLLAHLRTNNYALVGTHGQRLVQDTAKRLLGWCLQIAQGMEYLAAKTIVHRDLAARNCMLEENMVIKIADLGFSEKLYTKAYSRMVVDGTVKLPVKWMAPESIGYGIFSEKSDVWSFGVTCWEIFTGGITPYPGIHSSAIAKMRDHERIMDRPDNKACSEDMYGIMMDCWESDANDRPSFAQLVTVLTTHLETLAGGYLKIIAVERVP